MGSPSTSSSTKNGLAVGRRSPVEKARDVRMIESREDLPLAQEAPPDSLGVDAGLEKLHGHALLELPVAALGDPDLSHAAAPEKRDQDVGTDSLGRPWTGSGSSHRAARMRPRLARETRRRPRRRRGGPARESRARGRRCGARPDVPRPRRRTARSARRRPSAASLRRASDARFTRSLPLPTGAPYRKARAARHCRRTVRSETSSVRAISSSESPAKNRHSTTRASSGAADSRPFRASSRARSSSALLAAGRRFLDALDRKGRLTRTPLLAQPVPRVVDQDHAHRPRRHGVEVAPVPHRPRRAARELEVGLVDEARRVQRPVEACRADLPMREPAQLAINRLEEPIERLRIPGLGGPQQGSDFPRFGALGRTSRVLGHRMEPKHTAAAIHSPESASGRVSGFSRRVELEGEKKKRRTAMRRPTCTPLAFALALALAPLADAATFTVTSTADSGAGSLRQAILDANASSGADTIAFDITGKRRSDDRALDDPADDHGIRDDQRVLAAGRLRKHEPSRRGNQRRHPHRAKWPERPQSLGAHHRRRRRPGQRPRDQPVRSAAFSSRREETAR